MNRYPIYHIPMGRTIKDLSTCFLTYHILITAIALRHTHKRSLFSLMRGHRNPGRDPPTGGVAWFNHRQMSTLSSKVMSRCRRHPCILPHPSLPRPTIVDKMFALRFIQFKEKRLLPSV